MRYTVEQHFVTTDLAAAEAQATQRNKPIETSDAELLHREPSAYEGWCYWSDGKVTSAFGMTEQKAHLRSKAARKMIDAIRGSDTARPLCDGGWNTIAAIKRLVHSTSVYRGKGYASYSAPQARIEIYEMVDGSLRAFHVSEQGYFEGYEFAVSDVHVPMRAA